MQTIDLKLAKEYVMANYPNDPLLKHIAITLLEQLPRVEEDAVVVVRCDACKYWVEGRHHTGRCNALIQFHDAERYVTDESHFCSYGERKVEKYAK